MTPSIVKKALEDICRKTAADGFYIGFHLDDGCNGLTARQQCQMMATTVEAEYGSILSSPTKTVDPHGEATLLYKVDGLFQAYPIVDGEGSSKFFATTWSTIKPTGIVVVSHKLKMLSFVWACFDRDSQSSMPALWMPGTRTTHWASWLYAARPYEPLPDIINNAIYSKYISIFRPRRSFSSIAYEMCIDIDSHYRNALFYEKISSENEISGLMCSIKSAQYIMASQQKKIDDFNGRIASIESSLKKYEVDLYASRVASDIES